MWCAQFNDVGGSIIVEGEVFVKPIAIYIFKKTFFVVFTTKMYVFILTCNLVQVLKIIVVYLLSKLFWTYVTYEIDFYVFIGTIFYVTCIEFFEISYVERFYLPFDDKNFFFKRARCA